MKTIIFRPLRTIKKTGKITVTSYTQWRKVMSANQSAEYFGEKINLSITNEHLTFDPNERVYNHKGELLFWFNYQNPEILPKNLLNEQLLNFLRENDDLVSPIKVLEIQDQPIGKGFHYSVQGFDCDGIPVFSHNTQDYITTQYNDLSKFEVLTVGMVVKWYGWFLFQLENSILNTS